MSNPIDLLRAQRGLRAKIAKALGVTPAAVIKWRQVPAERVLAVEAASGIPRETLRPDLYPSDRQDAAA